MHLALFLVGIAKVVFGVAVGAAGIFLGSRLLGRLMRWGDADKDAKNGNIAAAVLRAAGLVALGLLVQHAVVATFDAMDLLYRGHAITGAVIGRFAVYGLVHVGVALVVGALVLAFGAWLFGRLTRDVDEMAEIRGGNVAPALVLGAVMIVMALMTAPGLRTALDGLLPLPVLPEGEQIAPS